MNFIGSLDEGCFLRPNASKCVGSVTGGRVGWLAVARPQHIQLVNVYAHNVNPVTFQLNLLHLLRIHTCNAIIYLCTEFREHPSISFVIFPYFVCIMQKEKNIMWPIDMIYLNKVQAYTEYLINCTHQRHKMCAHLRMLTH